MAVTPVEGMMFQARMQAGRCLCEQGFEHVGEGSSERGVWKRTRDKPDKRRRQVWLEKVDCQLPAEKRVKAGAEACQNSGK